MFSFKLNSISIIQNTYFNSLLQELEMLAEDRVGEEMLYEIIEVNKKNVLAVVVVMVCL